MYPYLGAKTRIIPIFAGEHRISDTKGLLIYGKKYSNMGTRKMEYVRA